jgi:hypothetical protein
MPAIGIMETGVSGHGKSSINRRSDARSNDRAEGAVRRQPLAIGLFP